jgi:hypothetical protein
MHACLGIPCPGGPPLPRGSPETVKKKVDEATEVWSGMEKLILKDDSFTTDYFLHKLERGDGITDSAVWELFLQCCRWGPNIIMGTPGLDVVSKIIFYILIILNYLILKITKPYASISPIPYTTPQEACHHAEKALRNMSPHLILADPDATPVSDYCCTIKEIYYTKL